MHPRPIDFVGAAVLTVVLLALVAVIVFSSLPVPEA